MDQSPAPSSATSAVRRIKPAGWVVIVLFFSGIGYGVYRLAAPLLARRETTPATPTTPGEPAAPSEPTTPPAPAAGRVVPKSILPREPRVLPQVKGTVARAVIPPLNGIVVNDSGAKAVGSEAEALAALVKGEAVSTIVSVGALAAHPEAIRAGVRAAWLVGASPLDAGIFPSCDREALASARLGVLGKSAAHLHLLAALAGEKLPEIQLFSSETELDAAVAEGRVNGGATRLARDGGTPPREPCRALPRAAFALVVARRTSEPLSDAELASLVALAPAPPAPEEVAAFFDPARTAPGGFRELFDSATRIWRAAGVIDRGASAQDADDRTFLEVTPQVDAAQTSKATRSARFGYPSFLDRAAD